MIDNEHKLDLIQIVDLLLNELPLAENGAVHGYELINRGFDFYHDTLRRDYKCYSIFFQQLNEQDYQFSCIRIRK